MTSARSPLVELRILASVQVLVGGQRQVPAKADLGTLCSVVLGASKPPELPEALQYQRLALLLGTPSVDDARKRMHRLRKWIADKIGHRQELSYRTRTPFPVRSADRLDGVLIARSTEDEVLLDSDVWRMSEQLLEAGSVPLNEATDLRDLISKFHSVEETCHRTAGMFPGIEEVYSLYYPAPQESLDSEVWREAHLKRAGELLKIVGSLLRDRMTARQAWIDLSLRLGDRAGVQEAVDAWLTFSPTNVPLVRSTANLRQRDFIAMNEARNEFVKGCEILQKKLMEQAERFRSQLLAQPIRSPILSQIATTSPSSRASKTEEVSPRIQSFIWWLAANSGHGIEFLHRAVTEKASQLRSESAHEKLTRAYRFSRIERRQLAEALARYYSASILERPHLHLYSATVGEAVIETSILSLPEWCHLRVPLGGESEAFELGTNRTAQPPQIDFDDRLLQAAVDRLADIEVAGTLVVNDPIYCLRDIAIDSSSVRSTMDVDHFLSYALSLDLLEQELIGALVTGASIEEIHNALPLRNRYLPSVDRVLNFGARTCAGGPIALLAIARPPTRSFSTERDYVLLVQERSARVINVIGRLAVIPKAFHQPLREIAAEVMLSSSLEREFEEELLGRDDLSGVFAGHEVVPSHSERVSEPMRWLLERRGTDAYRLELVGFGINLVTGNYEFPCLIVVDDEEWWSRFGGMLIANWEVEKINLYSSSDPRSIEELVQDQRWSNEGVFAFVEGLRRLAEIDSEGRVQIPDLGGLER